VRSAPSWSPDASRLACIAGGEPRHLALYEVGEGVWRTTELSLAPGERLMKVAWGAEGTTLLCVASKSGDDTSPGEAEAAPSVLDVPLSDGVPHRLGPGWTVAPGPQGDTFYVGRWDAEGEGIQVASAAWQEGSARQLIGGFVPYGDIKVSPDGSRVACVGWLKPEGWPGVPRVPETADLGHRVVVVEVRTARVTVTPAVPVSGLTLVWWSPDSSWVAFPEDHGLTEAATVSDWREAVRRPDRPIRLVRYEIGSGRTVDLWTARSPEVHPVDWDLSPDGALLAWVRHAPGGDSDARELELRVVRLLDGREALVAAGTHLSVPRWSPDGRRLAWVEGDLHRLRLAVTSALVFN
jgi:dipeptidyl aminopeptidase/acylaminoacyl peptidase